MQKPLDILLKNLNDSIEAKKTLIENIHKSNFNIAVEATIDAYKNGGRLYIAGNGGSAADAQHLAAEFVSKLAVDRSPIPAEALTVDTSILTAIGNDYGYENIFSRQVEGKMSSKDIFLGITTSGNSANIINALVECKKKKIYTIVFTGYDGGKVAALSDCCVIAPGLRTSVIQEIHILLAHTLCECVENFYIDN